MANAQDKQNEYSDKHGRGNFNVFNAGELVFLDTRNLPLNTVSSTGSNKLKHRFVGPFAVLGRHGAAYTIDLPKSMTTHPAFYVGRLKRYHDPLGPTELVGPAAVRDDQEKRAPQTEARPQELGAPHGDAEDTRRSKQVGKPAGRITDAHTPGVRGTTPDTRSKNRGNTARSTHTVAAPDNSWESYERLPADFPKAVAIWEQKRRQLRK
ncbi:Pol Polyprotein [Phytophthora megakarya]|uniref:Pol Polyprotein n=1 Tax=Phytophthora megakarya TaxID=4795 RepID=A0A225WLS0_9STRA|nr:Pol Polyprotein [Phytophthora megakarya]